MQKIIKAKPEHLQALSKCFRRCDEANPLCPDEETLSQQVEDGNVIILIDDRRVYGFAIVTRDIRSGVFGALPHKSADYYGLLDELGDIDENVIAIPCFMVDPASNYQENAKFLFDYLSATYRKPLMLIRAEANPSEAKTTFLKRYRAVLYQGDVALEGKLYLKKFEVDGLARGFAW